MISIAMTTYNGEKFVEKQLLSILNQTSPPDEIVICDDASKDGTAEILRKYAAENPCIRLYENKKNLGYIDNFIQAISLTEGDYIFLADQDDEWHIDKIEKMIRRMQQTGAKAICTDFNLIDGSSLPLTKSDFRTTVFAEKVMDGQLCRVKFNDLIYGNAAQGCTYCFTSEVKREFLKVGNHTVVHDLQILMIASLLGDVYYWKFPLIDYRIHISNAIGFKKKEASEGVQLKAPSKKPFMVTLIDDLDHVVKIRHKWYYRILFYLRIPYFVSKFRG